LFLFLYGTLSPLIQNFVKKYSKILFLLFKVGVRGGTVVEALRYNPEGRGIDS
jgi:hypothetical protein